MPSQHGTVDECRDRHRYLWKFWWGTVVMSFLCICVAGNAWNAANQARLDNQETRRALEVFVAGNTEALKSLSADMAEVKRDVREMLRNGSGE